MRYNNAINPLTGPRYAWRQPYFAAQGESGGRKVANGAGAVVNSVAGSALNGYVGSCTLTLGTTNAGRAALVYGQSILAPASSALSYTSIVYMPTASVSTDEFAFYMGLHDGDGTSKACVDGLFLRYDRASVGVNWHLVACNNSTETQYDTGIPMAIGSRFKFTVDTYPASGKYRMQLTSTDGALYSIESSTNMIAVGRFTGISHGVFKSSGTTSRTISVLASQLTQEIAGSFPP